MRATEKMISSRNVDIRGSAGQREDQPLARLPFGHGVDVRVDSSQRLGARAGLPCFPELHPDFSANRTCLALNGNADFPLESTVLQITPAAAGQAGSAWYTTPQAVQNGFSTTFRFQFTNASAPPADGIAFVIQNSSTLAISATGSGGALAYGDDDSSVNPSAGAGIPQSLAIEFDTFQNGWDPLPNPNVSHVAIQSCGEGRNTSHHFRLCAGQSGSNSTLGSPVIVAQHGGRRRAQRHHHLRARVFDVLARNGCQYSSRSGWRQHVSQRCERGPEQHWLGRGRNGVGRVHRRHRSSLRESEHPELDLCADSSTRFADRSGHAG